MNLPAAIHSQYINAGRPMDEEAIYLGPAVLIRSSSEKDGWYSVEEGRCTCPGFRFRGTCRHLRVAELAAQNSENEGLLVI